MAARRGRVDASNELFRQSLFLPKNPTSKGFTGAIATDFVCTQASKANAFAERWVGSVRRECLDWLIVGGQRHLGQLLGEYVDHYNNERPHR
ncbi:MAG TPA: integrase core domain-containing protein, partial [Candidatus Dormibacteraeota bacterium]|nr:integrase core domain-containing protein [Candidatus Dormibacteraeota bacterium]